MKGHAQFCCPACKGALVAAPELLSCPPCQRTYPIDDGSADFSGGTYYDQFDGPHTLSPDQLQGLDNEIAGATARIESFYGPLLDRRVGHQGGGPLRVLDSGCGNGLSVDLLRARGIEAWGNDVSALRKWQWASCEHKDHLVVAPSQSLPFSDSYFDSVISSGVLEHIGVEEHGGARYTVRPLPDRDNARIAFLRELTRVLHPSGVLYLDFPNGAFPIDFWHGTVAGQARFHSLREGFLPTVREIRVYLRCLGSRKVRALSPANRLQMKQVGQHWYGRAARLPMVALLRLMKLDPTGWLAASALNPYLVLEVTATSTPA